TAQQLQAIDLFEDLPTTEIAALVDRCVWHHAKKGDEVFDRQSDNRDIFFVISGRVRIVNFALSGREVAYAECKAGSYFGELSAIDGEPRSASVVALEDSTLASLDQSEFHKLLARQPAVAIRVLKKLVGIVRSADERIMDLATLSAYQRVYRRILELKRPDPVRQDSWLIYPLPTQAEIAAQASTTRETVARVLGQLQNESITQRKGRTLYIRELEKLEKLAERVAPGATSAE
ncbi:MAG: Crp/Fnr family transcriptional regulator, partial [Pseudomonadota bacterium]